MPPRYAYWTILIDNAPTAFRAASRDDLLPTLHQLRRKNADVVMKWFARGRLWESPEAADAAARAKTMREKRGRDWRPGGDHRDPRARFDKKAEKRKRREGDRDRHARGGARPPQGGGRPPGQRPWRPKPNGPRQPWKRNPTRPDRRWQPKPRGPQPNAPQEMGRRRRDDEQTAKEPKRG
jgi:hypothetical protein